MNNVMLPTGLLVPVSSYYPNEWPILQAISEIWHTYGVMTYCKPKQLRKFGETLNADDNVNTTVATFYNDETNETFSTTNDIDYVVSSDDGDDQTLIIEGHYYDSFNRKIFHVQQVTLTGQTPAELSQPLCRVTRYKVKTLTFGSEPSNIAGNISVYVASGTTVTAGVIATGQDTRVKLYGSGNQSQKGSTSTSYYDFWAVTDIGINAKKASGSTAIIEYEAEYRQEGGVWLPLGLEGRLRTASQSNDRIQDRPYVGIVPNNSDYRPIVNSDTNDMPVKVYTNGFLLNDINDPNSFLPEALKVNIQRSIDYPVTDI